LKLFRKKPSEKEDEKLEIDPNTDINIQIAKLAAKVESMLDIRKSYSERFSLMSEQIGELRGMILDNSKQIQKTEVASSKAIDLVEEVQPQKFMTQLRKTEHNIESLRASLETKESIMNDITEEIKKIRRQMSFYRGIEQVSKLQKEIKKDLFGIKKVQADVERHSDKTESIFIDLQKKYGELDNYSASLTDLEKSNKELQKSLDKAKFSIEEKADKKYYSDLKNQMDSFMTESRLEKIKEFTHDLQNFRKRSEENFEILKTVKQRTDDLVLAFHDADIHNLKINFKNLEKKSELLKIEESKNKQLIDETLAEQQKYKKIKILIQKQKLLQKQISELKKQNSLLQKKIAKTENYYANYAIQQSQFVEIQKTLKIIKKKILSLEKQSTLEQLKGMGVGLEKLDKAMKHRASKKNQIKNITRAKKSVKKKFAKKSRNLKKSNNNHGIKKLKKNRKKSKK